MKSLNLDTALTKIGIRIWAHDIDESFKDYVDIEETLIKALYEALSDGRLLSLIFSWQKIHGEHLIAEKFFKIAALYERVRGPNHLINAFCAYSVHIGFHKYKKGAVRLKEEKYLSLESPGAIKAYGAVDWLKKINILCPTTYFVLKEDSIMTSEDLIKLSLQYKNRFIYGANWRADIITAIQFGYDNPSKIKDLIGCSYEPANRIFKQYKMATRVA
jgi:hypothetical protein